jgi:integrase
MSFTDDNELIDNFHRRAGHSFGTVKAYGIVFDRYREFHDMSLCELLDEAISEQEQQLPINRLSIYDRILTFRDFMVENYKENTAMSSESKIKTFYHYNRVEIPFIPPLNVRTLKRNDVISFEDLPTKDELRLALEFADDNLKLWILVLISSGSSRADAKSMTNRTFFEGTKYYHEKDNFEDALMYLADCDDVVCTCRLFRQKTNKHYYAFLNPECVQEIARVKLKQKDFDLEDSLLKYNQNYVSNKFKSLNDYLGFGEVAGSARLRPHMLRKFHASYLNQGTLEDGLLNRDDIDALHGRGRDKTRETYFKENPEYLKLKYVTVMSNISLYHKYDFTVVDGRIVVFPRPLKYF